jgi:hypothetical protein
MNPFAPRPDRDAYAAIRGFVYQVDLTILRWLDLMPGQALELESGEDIDLIADALNTNPFPIDRLLEQVKHRETNVTLLSGSVLEAIANAIEHSAANVGHELVIRFSTNARIGREQGLPAGTPPGMGLLDLWEKLRKWGGCRDSPRRPPSATQDLHHCAPEAQKNQLGGLAAATGLLQHRRRGSARRPRPPRRVGIGRPLRRANAAADRDPPARARQVRRCRTGDAAVRTALPPRLQAPLGP